MTDKRYVNKYFQAKDGRFAKVLPDILNKPDKLYMRIFTNSLTCGSYTTHFSVKGFERVYTEINKEFFELLYESRRLEKEK